MAYNMSTGSRDFGDISYEDDQDTQIDFGSDSITFKTNNIGRFYITNDHVSSSLNLSASAFYGDGSTLSNLPAAGISWDGSTANGVATYKDADEATVESNLTFDGTNLKVAGNVSGSGTLEVVGGTVLGNTLAVSGNVTMVSTLSGAGVTATTLQGTSLALQNGGITAAGSITGTSYSGSSTLQAVGATTLGGTLNVSGAVTLAGPASGSLAGPGSYLGVNASGVLVLTESSGGGGGGGISWDGSTANGVATYKDSDEATVESNLTFDGTNLKVAGNVSGSGTLEVVNTAYLGNDVNISGSLVFKDPGKLANDTGSGEIAKFGLGTLTAGKLYYLHTNSTWTETDADAAATGADQLLGIALGSNPTSNGVLLRGYFDATTYLSNFSAGKAVYMSTTAAAMDTVAPSGTGDIVRVVGYCTNVTNVIYFNPDGTYVEI